MGSESLGNKADYKDSLNLPKTDFAMRGNLPQREPEQVQKWLGDQTYQKMVDGSASNKKKGKFLLHDGPPYANGKIHLGHALNKVLKDVVIKYKNMSGYQAEYIPGWDCHGLPIELAVEKELLKKKKDKSGLSRTEYRALCREYADRFIDVQMEEFQRLQVFGDWERRYRTMDPKYVASIIREVGRCSKTGFLYRGNKSVSWCHSCATALADAEIEYAEKTSPSIYVKFDLEEEALESFPELKTAVEKSGASRTAVVIWTTTPWTLPANMAIALHAEFEYAATLVETEKGKEVWILAKELQEKIAEVAKVEWKELLTFKAEKLHRQNAKHPFIDRQSLIVLGDHVTLEAGTGAVHIAPGHGADDYLLGVKYGIEIFSPVDHRGKYTKDFPDLEGTFVFKANPIIGERLRESGHLVALEEVTHSYPHCWRCHKPIIFRATPQWFIGVESKGANGKTLRESSVQAIHDSTWVPDWGINRILGMVESRPDWCVSRQRIWGVPLTVFYCKGCDGEYARPEVFETVAARVEKDGPDVWYTEPVEAFLPDGAECKSCGKREFYKEEDILDVWFDSGVSHAAVCERMDLGWPADLYLEGSDQHRGWFQTSMLTAVATRGTAPFKSVLTHGFINDKDGRKMSKSKGNVTSPQEIIKSHGAEILRLWVVLEDYRKDINFSKESLARVSESYRKIRNTLRFMLGNISDFDPKVDALPLSELGELDRWALSAFSVSMSRIEKAYEDYEFHMVYHELVNLCAVHLSSIYFDILKDRLYTAGKTSKERRSSQTALYWMASAFLRSIAPILSFTAEEGWSHLPGAAGKSIFLELFPSECGDWKNSKLEEKFGSIWEIRDQIMKSLEEMRRDKKIGHPREARVVLEVPEKMVDTLKSTGEDLARLFVVSQLELKSAPKGVCVTIVNASGEKCPRCWTYSTDIGESSDHPDLCQRCVSALG